MVTAATNVFLSCIFVLRRFKNGQEFSTNNEQHDRLCLDVNVKLEDLIHNNRCRDTNRENTLQYFRTARLASYHITCLRRSRYRERLSARNLP